MRRKPATLHQLFLFAVVLGLLVSGCMHTSPWRSEHLRDHPLVGHVWDVRNNRYVSQEELLTRLKAADYVLLGEKHDNEDHHRMHAMIVGQLIASKKAIAFEHIRVDQQTGVDQFVSQGKKDADGLEEVLKWESSGWSPFDHYEPIFSEALQHDLKITATNLSQPLLQRAIRKGEVSVFTGSEAEKLGVSRPLPGREQRALRRTLEQGHCGQLPKHALMPMIAVQRARDAMMALRLSSAADKGVLIAGNMHVRNDWGVPVYLEKLKSAQTVSVEFREVDAKIFQPTQYGENGKIPYDYVWFTPAHDLTDPCVKYQQQLEKMKKKMRQKKKKLVELLIDSRLL